MKSLKNGFDSIDLLPDVQERLPLIEAGIKQTLARLLGWNRNTEQFKLVEVDVDGRLLVSTSPTQATSGVNSNPTVGIAASIILNQNSSRRQYIVQNLGAQPIYLGFGSIPTTLTGFQIPSNGVFADDVFTGVLYAISGTAGQDVRVVEV